MWQRGRRHSPAKGADGQNLSRGFESLRLRQIAIQIKRLGAFFVSTINPTINAASDLRKSRVSPRDSELPERSDLRGRLTTPHRPP